MKQPPPNLRGETNRVRLIATIDSDSIDLLNGWAKSHRVLSRSDLLDRIVIFCMANKFNPDKSKNWNEQ